MGGATKVAKVVIKLGEMISERKRCYDELNEKSMHAISDAH